MDPTPKNVHVDKTLTNLSVAYMQDASGFVAGKVFPTVPVNKKSDLYWVLPRGYQTRDEVKERAPGAETEGIDWKQSTVPYFCKVYGLHDDLDEQTLANADLELRSTIVDILSEKFLIHKERKFAANYFTTGKWTTDIVGAGSTTTGQVTYWNAAGGNPVLDIKEYKRTVQLATGRRPNLLTVSRTVMDALTENADIKTRIQYTGSAPTKVTNAHLRELFDVDDILVMDASYNSAVQGLADSFGWIAGGDNALLSYRPPRPGLRTPSAGYTFEWSHFNGTGAAGSRVKRYYMDNTSSERIEFENSYDMHQVSPDMAVFFSAVLN